MISKALTVAALNVRQHSWVSFIMTLTRSCHLIAAMDSSLTPSGHICQQMFIRSSKGLFGWRTLLLHRLYHKPEILTLDQPSLDMLPSSICRGSRVWYEHKVLAKSPHRCCARFSEFDMTTDSHQYRHILPRCWRAALSAFGNVVRVQYLTVVVLDFVAGFWHLFLE